MQTQVNFGAQKFGEGISRLQMKFRKCQYAMQPNALLIWKKFIIAKSGCYKPTPLKESHPRDSGSARE
jgi:hypothetical protein